MRDNFDEYDTKKLCKALQLLMEVYDYNYDSSRKESLLATIIHKLTLLIDNCGHKEK